MLLAATWATLGTPSPTWGGSGWTQSPLTGAWYVVLPSELPYWSRSKVCTRDFSNASLPCIIDEAEAKFVGGLIDKQNGVYWTGLYQSASATKATEGWDAWSSVDCSAKTGLDAPWKKYSSTFQEPNWWGSQREACAMAEKHPDPVGQKGVLLDAPCSTLANCVCQGALPTNQFAARLSIPPERGMDHNAQLISVVVRSIIFIVVFAFVCSFLLCLKLPACAWRQFLEDERHAPSRAVLNQPRNCCGDIIDHEAARALHKNAPRVDTRPFDCIRGFGALQVAIGHYFTWWSPDTLPGIDCGGGNAVLMFFLMSGFIMQVGYAAQGPADGSCCCCTGASGDQRGGCCLGCGGHFSKTFWARRIARLWPLTWVSILIFLPIFYFEQQPLMGQLNGFVQGLYMAESAAIEALSLQTWVGVFVNGPLWTLCAQFFFYALFPTLTDKFHKRHESGELVCKILINWLIYAGTWFVVAGFKPFEGYLQAHVHPGNKLPLFLMGMALGSQALINSADSEKFRNNEAYWSYVSISITIFLAVYTLMQITAAQLTGVSAMGFFSRIAGELLFPPLYALWLYALSQSPSGLAARTFNWKPFRLLGDLSFAIYLLHFPLIHYYVWIRTAIVGGTPYWMSFFDPWEVRVRRITIPGSGSGGLLPWDFIPCFVIIFAVATLAHHTIEKPMRWRLQVILTPRRSLAPDPECTELEVALPTATAVPIPTATAASTTLLADAPVTVATPINTLQLASGAASTSSRPEI